MRTWGDDQAGEPTLTYNSDEVSVKPIVDVNLYSPYGSSLPASISARLTFYGSTGATVTCSTSGFKPGDEFTLALEEPGSALTTTGRYSYSVSVTAGTYSATYSGACFVVAENTSALGAGWTMAGVDQLVSISASGDLPAGMLYVWGSGGWRFFASNGHGGYTTPAGDNGMLTLSGGTYTYSTPDGETWTFNSSGLMTQWTSADTQETL